MTILDSITKETTLYAPLVLQTITSIEQAASQLPGQTKTDIALSIIQSSAQAAGQLPNVPTQEIASLVSMFVNILNSSGIFHRKAVPATPNFMTPVPVSGQTIIK